MKDDKLTKFLVICFGLYQAGHLLTNINGAFLYFGQGLIPFPALPPAGGWSVDMKHVFVSMASMDSLNAIASFVFVWTFFKAKPWRLWLGTITLTLSFYAALLFNFITYQAGAWAGPNLWPYLMVNILYLPVVLLYVKVLGWGISKGN